MEPVHRLDFAARAPTALMFAALLFASCSAGSIATSGSSASETTAATLLPTPSGDRSLTPTIAGPPANDNPPGIAIETLPYSYSVDVRQAQIHAMEMASVCGSGAQSVWFSYVSQREETLVADTLGSEYDTILDVYAGTLTSDLQNPGFEGLVQVACNDDARDSPQSEVVFAATAGTTYVLRVTTRPTSPGGNLSFHLAKG